ncbi:MAG: histidine kinase [Lachnospiraceae bacterium]|nr:histidine kinase [Lachnospiraceae bacterium]
MKTKLHRSWQLLDIRHKITIFTDTVLLIIILACILCAWIVRVYVVDFYKIMESNSRNGKLIQTLENEQNAFEEYIRRPSVEKQEILNGAMDEAQESVQGLILDYVRLGERIYAKTCSIQNSYEVYQKKRDALLNLMDEDEDPEYVSKLYEVYDMQSYLLNYARILMNESVKNGNATYHREFPWMIGVPLATICVTLLLFYLVIRLANMMNASIVLPVVKLADASRKIAANEFHIDDIKVENQDEIGDMVNAFNKMKLAMSSYIQTLEEKRAALDKLHEKEVERLEMERRLETAKIKLLQSQINPHFLFNTLNVIGGMANLEDADITEKMIKALSDLFRYTLNNEQSEVPLSREVKVINDYMYLQHMRFGVRISYKITCQADAEKIMVPVFTLQPLVENAIIHGLSPKVEGGRIKIRICERDESCMIIVADNGIGMKQETLCHLRERTLQEDEVDLGIGFANVYRRIKAMYPDGEIDLFSKENKGTIIRITIPWKSVEEGAALAQERKEEGL